MRILFLTSRLPFPPNRGDRLRTYHLLRQFSSEHEVTLASLITSTIEAERSRALDAYCEDIHLTLQSSLRSKVTTVGNVWRRQPLQTLYYRSAKMQELVDRLISKRAYDAVYVHLFRMAPYVAAHTGLFRLVDLTDLISLEIKNSLAYRKIPSRLLYRLELPRITRYEKEVAAWADETWLINTRERDILTAVTPQANIQVVPNGVDLRNYHPLNQSGGAQRVLFVGHLDVFHNIDAATFLLDEIFPRVRARLPGCTVQIAGPGTGLSLGRWAHDPAVKSSGFVPDLNRTLNEAAVFVAPLRFAAGVQNKVLEAMAAGTPVVATPTVNEGLAARPGSDLLLGSTADELAQAVVTLLQDDALRRQIGEEGRRFVSTHFTWQVALERLRQIAAHRA